MKQMTMAKRDSFFDALKGVLIFLVVLGHMLELNKATSDTSVVLWDFIYLFHMPLFIFVSGYFSKNINFEKLRGGDLSFSKRS